METNRIIFNSPASQWEEALPLGNGRLGAMIFGSPDREKIQLNEDSIWSGPYRDRNNPCSLAALPSVRLLLDQGRIPEAEELCLESFSGIPQTQRVYQTAGDLLIDFSPDGVFGHSWSGTRGGPLLRDIHGYRRELDIERAVHALSFEYNGIIFTRECFISAPAGLLLLRFSASRPGKISFRASLDRGVFFDRKENIEDGAFIRRDGDIPFCAMVKAVQKGGTMRSRGGFVTVEQADEALLFLDIRTGFRESDCAPGACAADACVAACTANIDRAITSDSGLTQIWERLLAEHAAEYGSWYKRQELEIDGGGNVMRYFNFCRYLLISCSRPGALPANLQGLWNPHLDPPWGSDYTVNINTQMNYWPACMCNLAETEEPLFDLLERMYPNGKKTAEIMYGCRGFVCHHNTDIWGDTAPRDYWIPASYWTLGAAWLSLHIWEHYEYTQDRQFLKKYFYLLKESCMFFVDFLVQEKMIVSPSSSPENSFLLNGETCSLCAGCAMDDQILRKLFDASVRASEILGITDCNTEFRSIYKRLALPRIHSNGTICEWNEEYGEAEPGHRHFSNLWALWPGDAITLDETPELAAAARKTLERRLSHSGGHTGWSRAWLVNFFARLNDGEAALENLNSIFGQFTLPNLLNNGPPFQIDGNFGALAGITQMLVQSRVRYGNTDASITLDILPALPKSWLSGRLKGARVKGNLELDIEWRNGKLTFLVIRNNGKAAIPVLLRAGNESRELVLEPGETHISE